MKRIRLAAVAIAIVMTAVISKAGQITYSLQNYATDQAGSTLTGSVTTDGNLGTLTAADIVAWTWTVSPPVGAPFTLSGVTSTVENLVATDTQLLLPVGQSNAAQAPCSSSGPLVLGVETSNTAETETMPGPGSTVPDLRRRVTVSGFRTTRPWEAPTPGSSAWPPPPFPNHRALCS